MNWYNIVKRYYDVGLYNKSDVEVFLNAGKITEEQYTTKTEEDSSQ